MVAISRFAHLLPGVRYVAAPASKPIDEDTSVLLVGYNGARNTGADVRVSALMDQIDDALAPRPVRMSLMSLDPTSTDVYTHGRSNVQTIAFTPIFFWALLKACSSHEVIVLCEGSMLKSKFANGLTLVLCQAAGLAKAQGKPCVAYGVEIGEMDPCVRRTAVRLCGDTRFIVRTKGSLEALHQLGLNGELGCDSAWTFDSTRSAAEAQELLAAQGWNGKAPLLGVAPINPFCWPAKPSLLKLARAALTGNWQAHYQKWYFLSWSKERSRRFDEYLQAFASAINRRAKETASFVTIIGMEKLDEEACARLRAMLDAPAALVLSKDKDGFVIGEVLARLETLVTSRYHAAMLAMKRGVASVGLSMDERIDNLFEDAGLDMNLVCSVDCACLEDRAIRALDLLDCTRAELTEQLQAYKNRCLSVCEIMKKTLAAAIR